MVMIKTFVDDERGEGAVEYGLLVCMIACFVISGLQKFGVNMNSKLRVISGALT